MFHTISQKQTTIHYPRMNNLVKMVNQKSLYISLCFIIFYGMYSINCLNSEIDHYFDLAKNGSYPGDSRIKTGTTLPVYTQRTSFLYYSRKLVSESIVWDTLYMGTVKNLHDIISDKKVSLQIWENHNPEKFEEELQKYIPYHCSDPSECDLEEDKIYVFKPSGGANGKGLTFAKGKDMMYYTTGHESWVIQEFINPFLYNDRKTHLRVLSLVIVRSNGTREFYLYNQMKLLYAPMKYEEDLLFDDDFISSKKSEQMLVTNLRVSRELFHRDPFNKNKKFDNWSVVLDSKEVLDPYVYDEQLKGVYDLHNSMYKVFGDMFECTPTDISIDDGCFHILASDVAVSADLKPYLLEVNAAMGIKGLWKPEEIYEFSGGASDIIGNDNNPFEGEHTDKWMELV